jgi:hypothetical protein
VSGFGILLRADYIVSIKQCLWLPDVLLDPQTAQRLGFWNRFQKERANRGF